MDIFHYIIVNYRWIRKQNEAGLIMVVWSAVIIVNSLLDTMESKWDYSSLIY